MRRQSGTSSPLHKIRVLMISRSLLMRTVINASHFSVFVTVSPYAGPQSPWRMLPLLQTLRLGCTWPPPQCTQIKQCSLFAGPFLQESLSFLQKKHSLLHYDKQSIHWRARLAPHVSSLVLVFVSMPYSADSTQLVTAMDPSSFSLHLPHEIHLSRTQLAPFPYPTHITQHLKTLVTNPT